MILISKIKAAAGISIFLAAVFVYTFSFSGCKAKDSRENPSETAVTVKYQYPDDTEMWKHIFSSSKPFVIPEKMPASVVIPHHDITSPFQNSFYGALSKQKNPSVVVLVSPDHFEAGKKQIVIPENTVFEAPDGILKTADLSEKLLQNEKIGSYVDKTEKPWLTEHGIYIHTPFIKHYFPDAEFFPILLKSFSKDEEFEIYENLAEVLNEILPQDALLIASVDFSHYQIPSMTELHDHVSMNTIQNGEDLKHIEVDSPESLTVIKEFARLRNCEEPVLIHRSCTYDFIPDDMVNSTSHQYWAFYSKDDKALISEYESKVLETSQRYSKADYSKANQTILIGGSGTVGAGVRYKWDWDRYRNSTDEAEIKLHDFAGTEARFLEGFDAIIFDVKPGDFYTSTKHGTQLNIKGSLDSDLPEEAALCKQEDFSDNRINILVVTINENFSDFYEKNRDCIVNKLSETYEVIVFRDLEGLYDGECIINNPERKSQTVKTGILCGKENIKGTVLCINWYDGKMNVETYDYESNNGVPPAINQGQI